MHSHILFNDKKNHTLYPYIDQLTNIIDEECNVHQFLLSLSMLSFITMCKNKMGLNPIFE